MPQLNGNPIESPKPKQRGRQRSLISQSAILSAVNKLLEKKSLREVTADEIARVADVSKATIYKWWPNKNLVALDAFLSRMESHVEVPNTGSARQDFTEQLTSVIRFYTGHGRIFCQFIAEGQSDPAFFAQFRDRFLKSRRDAVRVMWQRGVERGEIRGEIDGEVALDLIYGPMIFRLLTGHAPLSDAEAKAIVAAAFGGLQNCEGNKPSSK